MANSPRDENAVAKRQRAMGWTPTLADGCFDGFGDKFINNKPLKNGLLVQRIDVDGESTAPATNCPHLCIQHSPTGYEWGYEGSGPADLALNTLEAMLILMGYTGKRVNTYAGSCYEAAYDLHQAFKKKFIAKLSQSKGGFIPFGDMREWIETQLGVRAQDNDRALYRKLFGR